MATDLYFTGGVITNPVWSNNGPINITGWNQTGSQAQSLINISGGTFNTSAGPIFFDIDFTNTASSNARFARFRRGGADQFYVNTIGAIFSQDVNNGLTVGSNARWSEAPNLRNDLAYGISSSFGLGTRDVLLYRDAAAVWASRNGTTAQALRIYRTFTNSSNYERLALQSGSGYFEFAAETAGTGTANIDVRLTPAGTGTIRLSNTTTLAWTGSFGDRVITPTSNDDLLLGDSSSSNLRITRFSGISAPGIVVATGGIGFVSAGGAGNAPDANIRSDGTAGILAQRNSTNAQTFRLYRTFTDSSNYERLTFSSAANDGAFGVQTISAETAGTGTDSIHLRLIGADAGYIDCRNRVRAIGYSGGVVGDIGDTTYALSVQNNATGCWIEILNSGGVSKGAFFGMNSDGFEQYNWQGGDIFFYTDTVAASGKLRYQITNDGNHKFYNNNSGNLTNYERLAIIPGSSAMAIAAESGGTGSANIDVQLTPKGSGAVRFGVVTTAAGTTGSYITIKDSAGNSVKLAVFTTT